MSKFTNDAGWAGTEDAEIVLLSKYLSKLLRTLEFLLINCIVNVIVNQRNVLLPKQ